MITIHPSGFNANGEYAGRHRGEGDGETEHTPAPEPAHRGYGPAVKPEDVIELGGAA